MAKEKPVLVSACLAGVACRYDCRAQERALIREMVEQGTAIPVCPEQMGGLPTPRPAAEQQGTRVVTETGVDVTHHYEQGAQEAWKVAKLSGIQEAYLKSRSPMCGSGEIYDGTFSNTLVSGDGIFAALLKKAGIKVHTVE